MFKDEFSTREVLRIYFSILIFGFFTSSMMEISSGDWLAIFVELDNSWNFRFIIAFFSVIAFFATYFKSDKILLYLLLAIAIIQIPVIGINALYLDTLDKVLPNLCYLFLPSFMIAHQLGITKALKRHQWLGILIMAFSIGEFIGAHDLLQNLVDFLNAWLPFPMSDKLEPFAYLAFGFLVFKNGKWAFRLGVMILFINVLQVYYALQFSHFAISNLFSTYFWEHFFRIGIYIFLFPVSILLFLLIKEETFETEVKEKVDILDDGF